MDKPACKLFYRVYTIFITVINKYMNYKIIASKPVVNSTNKNLKNYVTVSNTRSNKQHVGYEYQNGRVDILQSAGFNMVWKTVIA